MSSSFITVFPCGITANRRHRFKNYEAAYAQGLTNDKEYASITSASQSTSSIARINKPGDSTTTLEKHTSQEGITEDDDDEDTEAGTSLPFPNPFPHPLPPPNIRPNQPPY